MDKKQESGCTCTLRYDLLRSVMIHTTQQAQINADRGGSCWGVNANAALMSLAQYLMAMRLLSKDFDPDKDRETANIYCSTEFCIFTNTEEVSPGLSASEIRQKMRDEAKRLAVPVLDALRGTEWEQGELFKRLSAATENLRRIVP